MTHENTWIEHLWNLPSSASLTGGVIMTYFIGIDIAKFKHDCFIMDQNGTVIRNSFTFSNDKTGFDQLLSILNSLDSSHEKRIGLEATGHYGMNLKIFLEEHDFSFMEINPILIKRFSSATTLRKTKTDKIDAALISLYLTTVEYKTYPTKSYHIKNLKSLSRSREALIKQRSLYLVQMTNVLDLVFPEFKPFFKGSLKSATCMYILENYTVPSKIANMNSASYSSISSKLKRPFSYARFTELKDLAKNTIGNEDEILVFQLKMYLDIYKKIDSKIKETEELIEKEFKNVQTHIHTIKGISLLSAASIFSEYGNLEAFETPNKMLAFAGLEPSRDDSGKHSYKGKMVKHGSSYLRQTIMNVSETVFIHNPVFYEFYYKKRKEGKSHRVALSHVARKLIRVIYYLEKNNVDFDSEKLR